MKDILLYERFKALEKGTLLFGGDSDTLVRHLNINGFIVGEHFYCNGFAFRRIFEGVGKQVEEYLLEFVPVYPTVDGFDW